MDLPNPDLYAPTAEENETGAAASLPQEPQTERAALPKLIVIGCSGHARVVVDIIEEENRWEIVGLLDTYQPSGTEVLGYQVLGSDEDLPALAAAGMCDGVVVAIGNNWMRSKVVQRIKALVPGVHFGSAVHPAATIARNVSIGAGTVIMAGVIVNPYARIGEFCILNTGCSLDHDSVMRDYSSLAPRAVTGGRVSIGAYSAVAIGATISNDVQIGEHAVLGAGSTLLKGLPDRVVAYGTPARVIRNRTPEDPYLGEQTRPPSEHGLAHAPSFVHSVKSLKLIPARSHEWAAYLDRVPHDFFQTAQYHSVETVKSGEAWLAVYERGDRFLAWPYILQDIRQTGHSLGKLRDINSVYGYAGPVMRGCGDDEAFLECAWAAIVEAWRSESVVSAFTRFHPVLANHRWVIPRESNAEKPDWSGDSRCQGKTVVIDLSRSQEEILNSYKRQLRQGLRRLSHIGMLTTPDPDWSYLDAFVRLYYGTMRRNKATGFYFFPNQYFRNLKDALGSHGSLIVARYGGDIIAAGLLIEYQGIVNLHLLATDDNFASFSPGKLIVHGAQLWAHERGNRFFHVGGGRGSRDDDPLFRFKAQFSSTYLPFYTGRWILDQGAYETLAKLRQQEADLDGRKRLAASYFPIYRAPLIDTHVPEPVTSSSHP
jgi:sugar O-acyltransferase (sialic acid O-acetyltransferase NeuD family)